MKLARIIDIEISESRQRQEFEAGAMEELRASIEAIGIMQAPVLRTTDKGLALVAGERRLRTITDMHALGDKVRYDGQLIPEGMIPYIDLGELSVLEAEEAELDENLKRKDLTWQELAAAHKRLHELRVSQADARAKANAPNGADEFQLESTELQPHTIADTAKEIHGRSDGQYHDTVRQELIVAKHLDRPEVAGAKNLKEAFKALKRTEQSEANIALAAKVGATFTAGLHRVFHANCLEWMSDEKNQGVFDVILTDPPYGMDANQFGDGGGKLTGIEHHYDDSFEAWQQLLRPWARLAYAVAKPEAHCYAFCDIDRFHMLTQFMEDAGWSVFRTPIIDYKTDSGRVPLPDRGPRRQWEMILYAIKGNKPVTHIYPDVIPCQADANMTHGAQKPVALYVNLLKRSVKPGDKVLDSFAGSGTILEACHTLQCEATALEQTQAYYGMILKRHQMLKERSDPLAGL